MESLAYHVGEDSNSLGRRLRFEKSPCFRVISRSWSATSIWFPPRHGSRDFDDGLIGIREPLYLFASCVFPVEESVPTGADGNCVSFGSAWPLREARTLTRTTKLLRMLLSIAPLSALMTAGMSLTELKRTSFFPN